MAKRFVVFSDLDGTLLDHSTYSFEPALPAIAALKQRSIPIVLNSSKTQPEMERLQQQIGLDCPFIVENGAAVIIPQGALGNLKQECVNFAEPLQNVLAQLEQRRAEGDAFCGFHDMSVQDVAEITGLNAEGAAFAKQRIATEPLLWQGNDEGLAQFRGKLQQAGLQLIKGGRFYHVMGTYDKGDAMAYLMEQYRLQYPEDEWFSVALGDSPNDERMLELADFSMVIKGVNSAEVMQHSTKANLVRSQQTGPRGWNETILELLDNEA